MKLHTPLLIAGTILIIIAVIIVAYVYEQGLENKVTISISPNSTKTHTFYIKEKDNYVIYMDSSYDFTYFLYHNNSLIAHKENVTQAEINITNANGNYNLEIKNYSNKKIEVTIILARQHNMNLAKRITIISGGICATGMIVGVIGLGLLLWNRKKEEKQYSRY